MAARSVRAALPTVLLLPRRASLAPAAAAKSQARKQTPNHQRRNGSKQQEGHDDDGGGDGVGDECAGDGYVQTLCEQGQLDSALDALSLMSTTPSPTTYFSLLKTCSKSKSLPHAKRLHAHFAVHMPHLTSFLSDFLVMTLAKCGAVDDALQISATLPHLTVFSWTAIISACAECGRGLKALKMYQYMQEGGVEPDRYTFVSLFKACGSIPDLRQGKKLHADARRKGFASDVFICNTLVSMYGKCGALLEAEDVFHVMSHHTIVSWNAMLSAYVEQGQGGNALLLYRQMQEEGMSQNQLTFVIALQACGTLAEKEASLVMKGQSIKVMGLRIGQALHTDARRKGYTADILVGNTLVSMYGKCGTISEAQNALDMLSECNIVSWTAMISAYLEQGQGDKALQLFTHMHEEGVSPNQLTFVIALQACGTLAEKEEVFAKQGRSTPVMLLEIGQALHADARRQGHTSDVLVCNTLMSMYGKCGALVEAEDVFRGLSLCDVVSWNAMLSAYVEQGQGEKASQLYKRMQEEHATLDEVTSMCILQASSETGSLEVCKDIHFSIVSAGYDLIPSVTATLIHAYGSCGSSADAQVVFDELLEPDTVLWNAGIAGHAGEGNSLASLHMLEKSKVAGTKPDKVTFTAVLSACCHTGLVIEGLEYFETLTRDHGITPDLQHYGIMFDLLGRAGDFSRIENMLRRMPVQADAAVWLCLLGACRTHGNLELAKQAFNNAVNLLPEEAIAYVLMSNIYDNLGLQECAAEVTRSG